MRTKLPNLRLLDGRQFLAMFAVVLLLCAIFIGLAIDRRARAANLSTINFQARLMNDTGSIAQDGNYNIQFKLYTAATPDGGETPDQGACTVNGGTPDEDCVWVESRTGGNTVTVMNGYVTVNLGSVTAFASTINWNQDLWLTMRVGGTGAPSWDIEMSPRLKLTAVPYAFKAASLALQTGSDTSTLSFDTQTDSRTILLPDEDGVLCIQGSSDCGFITGLGDAFIQGGNAFGTTARLGTTDSNSLQIITGSGGPNIRATFDTSNNLYLGNGATAAAPNNFVVQGTGSSTAGTAGANLTIMAGAGASATTGSVGGSLKLQGGNAGGSGNNNGGTAYLFGGTKVNSGTDGNVVLAHNGTTAIGNVGIGTATPGRVLDIAVSNSTVNGLPLRVTQAGAGDVGLELAETGQSFYLGVDATDHKLKISSSIVGASSTNMGYSTIGGSTDSNNRNTMNAIKFTAGASGTINTIYAYVAAPISSSPNNQGQAAIFSDSSGTPNARLGYSTGGTTLSGNAWNEFPITPVSVTNGTVYWLLYNTNGSTGADNNLKYDAGGTAQTKWVAQTYGTWPSTWPTTDGQSDFQSSIYAPIITGVSGDHLSASLFQMSSGGQTVFQNSTNTTTAFQVQNALGTSILNIDTSNARLGISTSAPTADLSFGLGANRVINVITQTTAATAGNNLTINSGQGNTSGAGGVLTLQAGQGGSTGAGGAVTLQGGSGGSTSGGGGLATVRGGNATAGNSAGGGVSILGGTATGSGAASVITITAGAGVSGQNTAGGNVNITSGAGGGNQAGGTVALQAGTGGATGLGGQITLTGGTGGAATFAGGAITIRAGTGVTSGIGGAVTLQGGTGGNTATGGAVTIQGGSAGGGTTNGANVNLVGGAPTGSGVKGLVVIDTPTFATASTQNCSSSCNVTQANIDSNGTVLINATNPSLVVTLTDPTITTAGRIIYVSNIGATNDFTLAINGGVGSSNTVGMKPNTTATMVWNGVDWTAAGASSSTDLQAAYNNTASSAGAAELVLKNTATSNGLTVRNGTGVDELTGGLLEVQTSIGSNLLTVNNNATEYANNGGAESSTFTMWVDASTGGAETVSRNTTTTGNIIATGQASTRVDTTTVAAQGAENTLSTTLSNGLKYQVSYSIKAAASSFTTLDTMYSYDGSATNVRHCVSGTTFYSTGTASQSTTTITGVGTAWTSAMVGKVFVFANGSSTLISGFTNATTLTAATSQTVSTVQNYGAYNAGYTVSYGVWSRVTCTFVAPPTGTTITSNNSVMIRQTDATSRTFYVDNLSVTVAADVNHAADGSVDDATNFTTNWTDFDGGAGSTTLVRNSSTIYDTSASTEGQTTANATQGIRNNMSIAPSTDTQYLVTFYARASVAMTDTLSVGFLPAGGTSAPTGDAACSDYSTQSLTTSGWTKITCLFKTALTSVTNPDLVIFQTDATARSIFVDALSVTLNTNTASNVQIGGANKGGPTTLLTLDRSSSAPIAANNDAYLGSMYYDTTSGRIQCYEADGWGACGAAPDNIVNLNPEYAGAVLHGSGTGTMTADFCSDDTALQINISLCETGQAKNFYKWTSPQANEQTYSIYVTYQLPATFNGFASDDTVQLVARTDSTSNAAVTYEMYKSTGSAVTLCGSGETTVVTSANTWQSVGINGNEATGCSLSSSSAGNFVIFKINMKAKSNASAYVSTLSFTTTGR